MELGNVFEVADEITFYEYATTAIHFNREKLVVNFCKGISQDCQKMSTDFLKRVHEKIALEKGNNYKKNIENIKYLYFVNDNIVFINRPEELKAVLQDQTKTGNIHIFYFKLYVMFTLFT